MRIIEHKKRQQNLTIEIQVLAGDRHNYFFI